MGRLTSRDFWESRHKHQRGERVRVDRRPEGWLRGRFFDARIRLGAQPQQSYAQYLFMRTIREHLPQRHDWSALEVGCAPGRNLVQLNNDLGYEPFGVEYSPSGAAETRRTFTTHGFNPENVIEADFFSAPFQERCREQFDMVLSCGFIEHFDSPNDVVAAHVNLMKPGGYFVCMIPNLLGYGYPYLALFGKELLAAHNCSIMRLRPYLALFDDDRLDTTFCGYVGVYQFFGVVLRHQRNLGGYLAEVISRGSSVLSQLMFLGLRGRAVETRWSPYLVYIGRKRT